MDVTLPDGTVIKDVPDGMSKADLTAKLASNGYDVSKLAAPPTPTAPAAPSRWDQLIGQEGGTTGLRNFVGKNAVMGGLEHAANVGATLQHYLNPAEWGNNDADAARRAGIKGGVDALGVDRNSLEYKNAGLATDIAATSGVGGLIAKPIAAAVPAIEAVAPSVAPYVGKLANAVGSAGFTTGGAPPANALQKIADVGIRSAGGAITGGASTGLINPQAAGTGALVGAALPPAMKAVGAVAEPVGEAVGTLADKTAKRLMQSALKPTIAQLRSGEADTAVQTLLDYGINPTQNGVQKLKDLIGGLNDRIGNMVGSSDASVSKQNVLQALADTRQKFGNQVSPTADLGAINNVEQDFVNHPLAAGDAIPVQTAQQMKQGTYKVLAGKYGQLGSAETEAQKSLARGLKDEIATAVPGVGDLNAEESRLLSTLSVTERRALMDANKNPGGLALLAHNPMTWLAFMADKSAAFKSVAARIINQAAPAASTDVNALSAIAYRGAPRSVVQNVSNP